MKRVIAGAVLLLLAVIAGGIFIGRSAAPAPAPEPTAVPTPPPTPSPPTPEPPDPEPDYAWACSTYRGARRWEDKQLRAVLASTAQYDPLFGRDDFEMSGAECAAKRERLAWMKTR